MKKAKNKNTRHYRLLKRLALKTRGKLFHENSLAESKTLLEKFYRLNEIYYELRYLSKRAEYGLDREVLVRVALQEGNYSAIHPFHIPWLSGFSFFGTQGTNIQKQSHTFLWLSGFLTCVISILVILLFVLPYRRAKLRKEDLDSEDLEKKRYVAYEEYIENEKLKSQKENEKEVKAATPPPKLEENTPKLDEFEDIEQLQNKQDALPPMEVMQDPQHVLIENERSLYLREHSYRLLQLALRDAPSYRRAALRTVIPSSLSAEAPELARKRVYDLFLSSTLLGSGRWSHIPVRDPLASPIHARIKKVNQRFVIYDMLSGSGLYLNNRKLLRPKGLKHGDEIRIGRCLYTFMGRS